jgi:hypothetical protein
MVSALACVGYKKTPAGRFFNKLRIQKAWNDQAMKMAMKANMKIKTAPPIGKMMCISGTMDSTTSVVSVLCEWSDMALPWVHYRPAF